MGVYLIPPFFYLCSFLRIYSMRKNYGFAGRLGLLLAFCVIVLLYQVEAIAVVEHLSGKALRGGLCRVLNVKALRGNGELYGGTYRDKSGDIGGHVRVVKDGKVVERACPSCVPVEIEVALKIQDYRIVSVQTNGSDVAKENIRYIRAALWADRFLDGI